MPTQHDMGADMGSLSNTPILLWLWLFYLSLKSLYAFNFLSKNYIREIEELAESEFL